MNKMSAVEAETAEKVPSVAPAKRKRLVLMLSLPLLIAAIGLYFWLASGATVGTDNAYVKQDVTAISTQVNGPVAAVYVRENQHVNRGDILYRIDPRSLEGAASDGKIGLGAADIGARAGRFDHQFVGL